MTLGKFSTVNFEDSTILPQFWISFTEVLEQNIHVQLKREISS